MATWRARHQGEIPEAPVLVPQPIWQVLYTRGVRTAEEVENHFAPRLKDLAHPFALDDMDKAVARLLTAYTNRETVAVYGDYDLDGTPAISLLKTAFEKLGFQKVVVDQPSRLIDGYGFHAHRIDKLKAQGVSLIVTVDVGITDIEGVDHARSFGIDVIVTDHHLPKEELPAAVAIVNPNKGVCGSQLGHLCGTGVAFYLVLALRMELKKRGLLRGEQNDFNPKELLDLFAIATLTDMVPLVRENRILVKHGLKELAQTRRPGLRALLQNLELYGRDLNSLDVGFKIAPKLNALSRLEEGLRPLDVFLASEAESTRVIETMFAINDRRRLYQRQALEVANELLKKSSSPDFVWVFSDKFHPGVISLVANELMQKTGLPAFVGAVREDGRISGSARAPSKRGAVNLQDVFTGVAGTLHKFGGHALAAGFETHLELAESLRERLAEYFVATTSNDVSSDGRRTGDEETIYYDAEMQITDFHPQFMKYYEAMGPYGQGFEAPVFLMRHLVVKKVKELKNKKFKYYLTGLLNDRVIEAPWFDSPQAFGEGSRVHILFEPQWNTYMGQKSLQAIVKDMRPV